MDIHTYSCAVQETERSRMVLGATTQAQYEYLIKAMTPHLDARHYISLILVEEMNKVSRGEISIDQYLYLVDALERQKFVPEHDDFFPAVRELANQVKAK